MKNIYWGIFMIALLLFLILVVLIIFTLFFIKDKFPIFFTNAIVFVKKNIYILKNEFIKSFKSITTKAGAGTLLFFLIFSYSKYRFFDYKDLIKWNERNANTIFYDYRLKSMSIESLYLKRYQEYELNYLLLGFLFLILIQIFLKKARTIPLLPILFFLILGERLYLANLPETMSLIERGIFKNNFSLEEYDKYMKLLRGFYAFIPISIGSLLSIKYLKTNKLNIFFIILGIVLIILCSI